MKKLLFFLILLPASVFAQGSAGREALYEPRYLIDLPTAGMIPHGTLAADFEFYQQNGLLVFVSAGLFDLATVGISYGGTEIIGNGSPVWNEVPGFSLRVRVINESILFPAILFGFDSQGKESFDRGLQRFIVKSPGFYIVASKNYELLGNLSFHGGINYSLERADGDRDPNLFIGLEKSIGSAISVLGEYNLGWNDSHARALGKGRGYLNAGLRISIGGGFSFGVNLKDLLKNQNQISVGNRTVVIEYLQNI